MITFKEYLNEDAGDRAAQKDREWLAKKIDLIELVKKQLNDSVRTAHNLNYITSAKWRLWRGQAGGWSSSNLRRVLSALKPDLQKTAVVFSLLVDDTRPKDGPLGTHQFSFLAVVIVEPINGDMIAVPSLLKPHEYIRRNGQSMRPLLRNDPRERIPPKPDAVRIKDIVKAATQQLTFYARNHHKIKRG